MRLITRSDFDGMACAALLEELGIIDEIYHAHPKDLQDNKIEVTENDVLANVPFVEGCGLWFDHHSSEQERLQLDGKYEGASILLPSAAHVIYDYYREKEENAPKLAKFKDMIVAVDKADSGMYTREDILDPQGWMMLAFIADPRTGLGYHRDFKVSNLDLMRTLPTLLRTKTIEEILAMPDFQERVQVYRDDTITFSNFIKEHSYAEGDAIIIDLRRVETIPSGNRFIEYTLYPEQNISVRLVTGKFREVVMISIGHSILNRTSEVDVGTLTLKYGGGGHKRVGTCQVPKTQADDILQEILTEINS
ncbi:exopolyphosphatase [candidate division CSSED10-310 bacterium]|uniref:Exopolyphosphatase n=1 Tax=candidate division CSSED10-310 bacterium TaxID=2855610 RepID=A0ABV6YSB3_UNCC1